VAHPCEEVLSALVESVTASFAASPSLQDVLVIDGPPLANIEAADMVALGLSLTYAVGAAGDNRPAWGGVTSAPFDIRGSLQSWSGDNGLQPRRARALALLDGVDAVLKADQQLGGTCDRAYLSRWNYQPVESPQGASVVIEFTVRVDKRVFL